MQFLSDTIKPKLQDSSRYKSTTLQKFMSYFPFISTLLICLLHFNVAMQERNIKNKPPTHIHKVGLPVPNNKVCG